MGDGRVFGLFCGWTMDWLAGCSIEIEADSYVTVGLFFYAKYGNIKFAYYALRLIARDTPKKFAYIEFVCYDIYINQKIDKTNSEKEIQ